MVKAPTYSYIPEVIKRWQMNAVLPVTFLPYSSAGPFRASFGKGFFAIKATLSRGKYRIGSAPRTAAKAVHR